MKRPLLLIVTLMLLGTACLALFRRPAVEVVAQDATAGTGERIGRLQAEVQRLNTLVPDQATAMVDVGHHFSLLWLAEVTGVSALTIPRTPVGAVTAATPQA